MIRATLRFLYSSIERGEVVAILTGAMRASDMMRESSGKKEGKK